MSPLTATAAVLARSAAVANSAGPETLLMARICLLDWLGVTIAGARAPVAECLLADALDRKARGSTRLVGRRERLALHEAVLINGAAGHALDYDDGSPPMSGHPGVAIFPAVLALALECGSNWASLLRATVLGYEAAGRIGLMMAPDHYSRGFHATSTVGALSSAAACAGLLTLDPRCTDMALGLAATRAGGLKASFGSDAKPLHAGWASLVGLTSVQWAARGMTGASDILGHRQGFGAAMSESYDPARGLGSEARPLIHTTKFKAHAACGVTHPAIRAALALRSRIGNTPITAITITVSARADDICNIAAPTDGLALKFSLAGVVAMAIAGINTADIAAYVPATCARADWQALMERITVSLKPDRPIPSTVVTVQLADGRTETAEDIGSEPPDPAACASTVATKFAALAAPILGHRRAATLRRLVMDEPAPDLRRIVGLTFPPPAKG